jgi:bifunctional DNase/RNase
MLRWDMSSSSGELVELDVREVRPPSSGTGPAVVVCPRGQRHGPSLAVPIGAAEAHALYHELNAQDTPRSHALLLLGSVIEAVGGRACAARLTADDHDGLGGLLEIELANGRVQVGACPSQALAVAVRLGLPLLADASLLADAPRRTSLETVVADLVNGLRDADN